MFSIKYSTITERTLNSGHGFFQCSSRKSEACKEFTLNFELTAGTCVVPFRLTLNCFSFISIDVAFIKGS